MYTLTTTAGLDVSIFGASHRRPAAVVVLELLGTVPGVNRDVVAIVDIVGSDVAVEEAADVVVCDVDPSDPHDNKVTTQTVTVSTAAIPRIGLD
jgi:hypothetical protein